MREARSGGDRTPPRLARVLPSPAADIGRRYNGSSARCPQPVRIRDTGGEPFRRLRLGLVALRCSAAGGGSRSAASSAAAPLAGRRETGPGMALRQGGLVRGGVESRCCSFPVGSARTRARIAFLPVGAAGGT